MKIHLLQGLFQILKTRFMKYSLSKDFDAGVCPAIVYLQNHCQILIRIPILNSALFLLKTHSETNFIFQAHSLPLL